MRLEEKKDDPDILQPIPFEEWPLLQNHFRADWPTYSNYYYWIENSIKWKKVSPELEIQIHSIQGDYQRDGTFIGISNFSITNVWVFATKESGKIFSEALSTSKRFDWSREIMFCGVHEHVVPFFVTALDHLKTVQGIEIASTIPARFRFKSANDAAKVEVRLPDECYMAELNQSHVSSIHSVWTLASKEEPENTTKFIEAMLRWNKSMGLFLKEGYVLVSWCLQSDWHGLGSVHTHDAYQRRGYAKVVVNIMAKRLGEEGIDPILAIANGNTPSEHMFETLGWKSTNYLTWTIIRKKQRKII